MILVDTNVFIDFWNNPTDEISIMPKQEIAETVVFGQWWD